MSRKDGARPRLHRRPRARNDPMGFGFDRPLQYILDEHGEPQPCDDVLTFARWFQTADRRVAQDLDEGDGAKQIRVSTVFLGLDHSYIDGGPPVLWETMVFGGALDGAQDRYTSKDDALKGHQRMCERVMAAKEGS